GDVLVDEIKPTDKNIEIRKVGRPRESKISVQPLEKLTELIKYSAFLPTLLQIPEEIEFDQLKPGEESTEKIETFKIG
ncbi:hypothetical protein ABTN09_21315, partial [Acinetobacter baumannii]